MDIPGNESFIGNDHPRIDEGFDARGELMGVEARLLGEDVFDAGTEVNDELPANTAFFGPSEPDTQPPEGVSRIQGAPLLSGNSVPPLEPFTFRRLDSSSTSDRGFGAAVRERRRAERD